jgi:hypothetical protein
MNHMALFYNNLLIVLNSDQDYAFPAERTWIREKVVRMSATTLALLLWSSGTTLYTHKQVTQNDHYSLHMEFLNILSRSTFTFSVTSKQSDAASTGILLKNLSYLLAKEFCIKRI